MTAPKFTLHQFDDGCWVITYDPAHWFPELTRPALTEVDVESAWVCSW